MVNIVSNSVIQFCPTAIDNMKQQGYGLIYQTSHMIIKFLRVQETFCNFLKCHIAKNDKTEKMKSIASLVLYLDTNHFLEKTGEHLFLSSEFVPYTVTPSK